MPARDPRIGDYEAQVPVEEGLRRIVPENRNQGGEAIGSGLEQLGSAAQRVEMSEASVQAMQTLNQTQTTWRQNLAAMQQQAGAGAPNFTNNVMEQYGKYVDQTMKQAPGFTGKFLQERLSEFGSQLASTSMEWEVNQRKQHALNVTQDTVNTLGEQVRADPTTYDSNMATLLHLTNGLNVDPAEREHIQMTARGELAKQATYGHIDQAPAHAVNEILDPNTPYNYIKDLTPDERQAAFEHSSQVIHQQVDDARRLQEMQEHEDRLAAEKLVNQGITMNQQGKLTSAWVEQNARLLSPAEHERLLDLANGKDVESDKGTIKRIMTGLASGEDIRGMTNQAFSAGHLSQPDYIRFMGASDKNPPWYKQGHDFIEAYNRQSLLNFDETRAQSEANQQNDFLDWSTQHPQATRDEAEKYFKGLVSRYSLNDAQRTLVGAPMPDYLVGNRSNPDIAATKKAIATALASGKISRDKAEDEALKLQTIEHAIAEQKRAQADAAAKGNK